MFLCSKHVCSSINERTSALRCRRATRRATAGSAAAMSLWCGLEGPRNVAGTVEDGGDGAYTATYCTQAAGQYTLHVTNGACLGHPDMPHNP